MRKPLSVVLKLEIKITSVLVGASKNQVASVKFVEKKKGIYYFRNLAVGVKLIAVMGWLGKYWNWRWKC